MSICGQRKMKPEYKYFHVCLKVGGTGLLSARPGSLSCIFVNDFVRTRRENNCPNTFLELWSMFVNVFTCSKCDWDLATCIICDEKVSETRVHLLVMSDNILSHLADKHNMIRNFNIGFGYGTATFARVTTEKESKTVKICTNTTGGIKTALGLVPYMIFVRNVREIWSDSIENDCIKYDYIELVDLINFYADDEHICSFCDEPYDAFPTIELFNLHIRECILSKN